METNNPIKPAPEPQKPKVVQTFAEDMAGALEVTSGMEIKKIIHNEEDRDKERENLSPQALKNRLFLGAGFGAIFIAVALLTFFLTRGEAPTVGIPPQFVPLIYTDQTDFLDVSDMGKDQLGHTLRAVLEHSRVKPGGVAGIYLTEDKQVMGLPRFLEIMKANFTPDYTYMQKNFLLGYAKNETDDFFIILKATSVTDIFGSMKAWEKKMFSDLHGLFGIDLTPETGPLLTKDFEDGIVENKNARILYDADRKIVMMYVFPDDNSVIITNTSETVEEIIVRLAQNQIKKD